MVHAARLWATSGVVKGAENSGFRLAKIGTQDDKTQLECKVIRNPPERVESADRFRIRYQKKKKNVRVANMQTKPITALPFITH